MNKKQQIILGVSIAVAIVILLVFALTRKKTVAVPTTILGGGAFSSTPPVTTTTDPALIAVAQAVIRGEYGNGEDRKARLAAAGYDYATIQAIVNELYTQTANA